MTCAGTAMNAWSGLPVPESIGRERVFHRRHAWGNHTHGRVTGTLPGGFTLTDTSFFNEYRQVISSATTLSFDFEATSNTPDSGALPDTFSFFSPCLTGLPAARWIRTP